MTNLFLEMLAFLGYLILGGIILFIGLVLVLFIVATIKVFRTNSKTGTDEVKSNESED